MSLAKSVSETCEPATFWEAIGNAIVTGIAHTDIGLTTATVILAVVTWNLIDDRKQERIRHHMTHLFTFRHTHAERDTFGSDGNLIEHAEIDHTEINGDD